MVKRARTFPVSFLLSSFPSISLIQPQINCRYSEVSYYVSKIKIRQVFSAIFYLLLSAPEREKERERIQNVGKELGEAWKLRNYWEFRGLWVCQDAVCWGRIWLGLLRRMLAFLLFPYVLRFHDHVQSQREKCANLDVGKVVRNQTREVISNLTEEGDTQTMF